ncbi:uncharacterized protein LOC100201534 [Hydra vulgaris]|uniref:uncharacterized protein LOC100201534 n=1 Tax=Hydra vulgaris TaxID=6087 RepID=UPI0001923E85|nr:uncharacterized protein LOC100201534 [Hydra vulgaris]
MHHFFLAILFITRWILQYALEAGPDLKNPSLFNYNLKGVKNIGDHVKHILAFGDSLTEGYLEGGARFHPYTTELEKLLNTNSFNGTRFQIINEGMSGECAFVEMNTRLPLVLDSYVLRFDLALILGGTNDLRRLDCAKKINVAYEVITLHKLLHKRGIPTVVITIPEHDDTYLSELRQDYNSEEYKKIREVTNNKLRGFAKKNPTKTLLCDLAKLFPMSSLNPRQHKQLWDDTVHPSEFGYNKIASIIFKVVRQFFRI